MHAGDSAIASNMTVEEGRDVLLWCPGSVNNENQRVIWWKEESDAKNRIVFDGAVRSVFEPHMSFDGTTGILTIYKANLNDSGVFWCAVGFGEASFKIHLTILGKFFRQQLFLHSLVSLLHFHVNQWIM